MAFQLVGEVIIDGRRGTIALKDLQREATKTSKTFEQAGHSTERLGKSLLHLGLNAGSAHASLRSLERLGAAGLFAGAAAAGITKFGETVKKSAEEYYQSRKSLNDAFETSFKSASVEQAQEGISKTESAIESLQGKLAQLGAMKPVLDMFEKFTGVSLGFGDTKKALEDAQKNLEAQKQILDMRKKEKEQIESIQEDSKRTEFQRKNTAETLKLIDSIRKTKKNTVPILEMEVQGAIEARNENERIIEVLKSNNGELRNKEEIQKRINNALQLELNITKAQNALTIAKRAESGETLKGSKAGQIALENARKAKERQDEEEAFRKEYSITKQRQEEENKKRKEQGLPPLSMDSIRRKIAEEAIGAPQKPQRSPWEAQGTRPQMNWETSEGISKPQAATKETPTQQLISAINNLAKKIPAAVPV